MYIKIRVQWTLYVTNGIVFNGVLMIRKLNKYE